MDSQGFPILTDPIEFEEMLRLAKASEFDDVRQNLRLEFGSSENGDESNNTNVFRRTKFLSKMQAANRKSELWNVAAPRLSLMGTLVSSEVASEIGITGNGADNNGLTTVTDGNELAKVLGTFWGQIFSEKDTLVDKIRLRC